MEFLINESEKVKYKYFIPNNKIYLAERAKISKHQSQLSNI